MPAERAHVRLRLAFFGYWTLDKSQVEQSSDLHFNKICGIIPSLTEHMFKVPI